MSIRSLDQNDKTKDKKSGADKDDDASSQKGHIKNIRRRKTDQASEEGGSIWLISFTDVMALMLTFFVLLFAMSNPDQEDWEELTSTVQSNFNRYYGQVLNRGIQDTVSIDKVDFSQALDLSYLQELLRVSIRENEALKDVELFLQPGSLVISLPETILFEPGQAVLNDETTRALFAISEILGRIRNRIEVIGYTDPRPISSQTYPSNWELSFDRAAAVSAALARYGYDKDVIVRGQAAGRYGDLSGSLPERERLALSRRVDIIIMEDDGKRLKLFDIGGP